MQVSIQGKLTLDATNEVAVALAENLSLAQILDDEAHGAEGDYQEVHYVRGPAVKFFYRGNERTNWTFTVPRTFKTIVEAETFRLTHRAKTPKSGTVWLFSRAGDKYAFGTLKNARLTMEFKVIGVTVLTTYHLAGGVLSLGKILQPA